MDKYIISTTSPEITQRLFELSDHTNTTKALMSALGDYWTAYFKDYEALASVTSGCVVSMGIAYRKLLNMVLQSNIVDIPCRDTVQLDLLCFAEQFDDGTKPSTVIREGKEALAFYDTQIKDTEFLTTSLFESPVVLERGKHFSTDGEGGIYFYVDIFNDEAITGSAYRFDEYPNRKVLFWATNIVLSSTYIYERYGVFLYRKAVDSERYKWFVTALMFFYANNKSVKNVENVLNILYGVPFATVDGEVVKRVYLVDQHLQESKYKDDDSYYCIETSLRNYYVYSYGDVIVKPGDVLKKFDLLAQFHTVDDYITNPLWYENAPIPAQIFAGNDSISQELEYALLDNVLKYNMIYVQLTVSYQTWDTYVAQEEEIKKVVKAGIPVYLYPCMGTVFRASFEDHVESDDVLDHIFLELIQTTRYTPGNKRYDGEFFYHAHAETDHGSKAELKYITFDGSVRYVGQYKNLKAMHRIFAENADLFDGTKTYDGNISVLHDTEREIFSVHTVGVSATDYFNYSPQDGTVYKYSLYNNTITHGEEGFVYDVNPEKVIEVRAELMYNLAETVPSQSESLHVTVYSDNGDTVVDYFEV